MSNWNLRVLVALLTFTIGLAFAKLWVAYRRLAPPSASVEINIVPESKPTAQPITFSADGLVSAFQPYYHSSDGAFLRYGCFEYASPSRVAIGLREHIFGQQIIERAPKLNDKGERIGERVVLTSSIFWTEGSRLFLLRAPSLKYALLFEQSQVWASDDYCVNVSELRKRLYSTAQPNKSFERTAR
jgi:hypothetical protein